MFTIYKVKQTPSKVRSKILTQKFLFDNLSQFCEQEITPNDLLVGPHGKPYLTPAVRPKVCFNLSHSESYLALACSRRRDIGLDIQVHRNFSPKVLQRICAPEELADVKEITPDLFFKIWTIKEAALKCLGTGFQFPVDKLVIDFEQREVILKSELSKELFIFNKKVGRLRFKQLELFANTTSHLVWNFV